MRREENSYWREAGTTQNEGYEPRNLLEEMLSRPAGQTGGFDLEREVAARPLLAFGAALTAGFLLGSMGDKITTPYSRGNDWLAPLDRELDTLKSAALAALTSVATENIRGMVPGQTGEALTSIINRKLQDMGVRASQSSYGAQTSYGTQSNSSNQGHNQADLGGQQERSERAGAGVGRDTGSGFGGQQTSSSPNASFSTGAGVTPGGYSEAPPSAGSVSLENSRVEGTEHLDAYYPPGGAQGPIAGGRTPGRDRALDTHEVAERKPDENDENKDLNWR